MASNSDRKSGSSGRSSSRKRVVIGAEETVRVRYKKDRPEVESERKRTPRQAQRAASERAPLSKAPKPSGAGRRIAAEKRDDRDRRRRTQGRRQVAIAVAVVLALVGLLWGGVTLWNAPVFAVKNVDVSGLSHLKRAEVLALAAVPPNATLLRLPKNEIEQRVASSPWVQEVTVERQFPNAITIAVVERAPLAAVDTGGAVAWLISGDGHWIALRTPDMTASLASIRDVPAPGPRAGAQSQSPELLNALQVLGGLTSGIRAKLKAISAPSVDKTALLLTRDIQVFVGGSEGIGKKSAIAEAILNREKDVVYVNVRVVDKPTWRGLNQGP